jgi:hypothetical protein
MTNSAAHLSQTFFGYFTAGPDARPEEQESMVRQDAPYDRQVWEYRL